MTFLAVGSICPVNLTSPTPNALPLPLQPDQERKKPQSCQSESSPRQPGITGSPSKWQPKNHSPGLISSSAVTSPLPRLPPVLLMSVMRSTINILPLGSFPVSAPNRSPLPQRTSSFLV